MLEIVPLTKEHFIAVYGNSPSRSMGGYTLLEDSVPRAVAGVYYYPDQVIAFCNISPGAEHLKWWLSKGALKVLKMIKDKGVPVLAIADPSIPTAEDFLMRCGFQYLTKGPNGEVFVCKP